MGKKKDLVLTYVVHRDGEVKNNEELNRALEDGYRILDVKPIPVGAGSDSSWGAYTFVTVVLTCCNPSTDGLYYKQ